MSLYAVDIIQVQEKAQAVKATGGKLCSNTTSRGFKARKNDGSLFVGAFCQSNVGDVTPNVVGAFCSDSGKPCDFDHSSCHGDNQLCLGRGPGYFIDKPFGLNGLVYLLFHLGDKIKGDLCGILGTQMRF